MLMHQPSGEREERAGNCQASDGGPQLCGPVSPSSNVWPCSSSCALQNAPKTGQHTVEDTLRDEALALFFDKEAKTRPTTGGVNNVVNVSPAYTLSYLYPAGPLQAAAGR